MILQKSKIYETNLFTEENLKYSEVREIFVTGSKNKYWYDWGCLESCKKDYRSLVKYFLTKCPNTNNIDVFIKKSILYEREYIALSLSKRKLIREYFFTDILYKYVVTPEIFDIIGRIYTKHNEIFGIDFRYLKKNKKISRFLKVFKKR